MNEVVVLKEGYSFMSDEGHQKADGTITLVKCHSNNILFDTGLPLDKNTIIQGLEKNGLSLNDVSVVVCSHGHSDHVGNIGLFPHAKIIVGYDICHSDIYEDNQLHQGVPYELETNVKVIPTPGHTGNDVSLVINETQWGTVVLSGDLFECEEDIKNDSIWKRSSDNVSLQAVNRRLVVNVADYIIPGHGPMFRVSKDHRDCLSL